MGSNTSVPSKLLDKITEVRDMNRKIKAESKEIFKFRDPNKSKIVTRIQENSQICKNIIVSYIDLFKCGGKSTPHGTAPENKEWFQSCEKLLDEHLHSLYIIYTNLDRLTNPNNTISEEDFAAVSDKLINETNTMMTNCHNNFKELKMIPYYTVFQIKQLRLYEAEQLRLHNLRKTTLRISNGLSIIRPKYYKKHSLPYKNAVLDHDTPLNEI